MTRTHRWRIGAGLGIGIGLLTGCLAFAGSSLPQLPVVRCRLSTLRGQYVYTGQGKDNNGNLVAESGWEIYNGDGTMNGMYSQSTNGTIISRDTYTGNYTVNSDCSGTLTTSDGSHYDQFISQLGNKFMWIETDTGFTFSGGEWRSDQ